MASNQNFQASSGIASSEQCTHSDKTGKKPVNKTVSDPISTEFRTVGPARPSHHFAFRPAAQANGTFPFHLPGQFGNDVETNSVFFGMVRPGTGNFPQSNIPNYPQNAYGHSLNVPGFSQNAPVYPSSATMNTEPHSSMRRKPKNLKPISFGDDEYFSLSSDNDEPETPKRPTSWTNRKQNEDEDDNGDDDEDDCSDVCAQEQNMSEAFPTGNSEIPLDISQSRNLAVLRLLHEVVNLINEDNGQVSQNETIFSRTYDIKRLDTYTNLPAYTTDEMTYSTDDDLQPNYDGYLTEVRSRAEHGCDERRTMGEHINITFTNNITTTAPSNEPQWCQTKSGEQTVTIPITALKEIQKLPCNIFITPNILCQPYCPPCGMPETQTTPAQETVDAPEPTEQSTIKTDVTEEEPCETCDLLHEILEAMAANVAGEEFAIANAMKATEIETTPAIDEQNTEDAVPQSEQEFQNELELDSYNDDGQIPENTDILKCGEECDDAKSNMSTFLVECEEFDEECLNAARNARLKKEADRQNAAKAEGLGDGYDNNCEKDSMPSPGNDSKGDKESQFFIDSFIMDLDAMEYARRNKYNAQNICEPKQPTICSRSSFPVTITEATDLGISSLYIKWVIHDTIGVGGYEIYVDGRLTNRYFNGNHDAAVICDVDVSVPHKIVLIAQKSAKFDMEPMKSEKCKPLDWKTNITDEQKTNSSALWTPSIYLYDPTMKANNVPTVNCSC